MNTAFTKTSSETLVPIYYLKRRCPMLEHVLYRHFPGNWRMWRVACLTLW